MPRSSDRRRSHIVVVSDDPTSASAVGLALARRLHRPFLDGTITPEAKLATSPNDATATAHAAVLAWYDTATGTSCGAVIAAPVFVLDPTTQRNQANDIADTWTVLLSDRRAGQPKHLDPERLSTHEDRQPFGRSSRRSWDVGVDIGGSDVDHVVERLVADWNRRSQGALASSGLQE